MIRVKLAQVVGKQKVRRLLAFCFLFLFSIGMISNRALSRYDRIWHSDKVQIQIPASFSIGYEADVPNQYYLEYMTLGPYDTARMHDLPKQILPKGRCYVVHQIGNHKLLLGTIAITDDKVSVEELSELIEGFSVEGVMAVGDDIIKKDFFREVFYPYELNI